METGLLIPKEFTESQFREICQQVKKQCGINLHEGKRELVKARLGKRLRQLQLGSFGEYLEYVREDTSGTELTAMLYAISTNQTSFFREEGHFEYLARTVFSRIATAAPKAGRKLRIWSAGCSSGEEPYSIAMTADQSIPDLARWDAQILATDISTRMLARAQTAVYDAARIKTVAPQLRSRYFTLAETRPERTYRVNPVVRGLVHFARLNLMGTWPMSGPFDVIFCRNVMIYFDKPTQERLIHRFWSLLASGGTFFIGHSESLSGISHKFQYIQPTVYEKL